MASSTATTPPAPGLGEFLGMFNNIATVAFFVMLWADRQGHIDVVDVEYKKTSFCVTEETDGAIHSYKLCFYVDTAIAAFLLLMAASGRKSANIYGAAISVFSHGVFHMSQYVFGWPPLPSHIDVIIGPFFTLCMLLGFGYGNTVGNTAILIAMVAVLEAVRMMFVPIHYTFAYINGWIYAVATIAGVSIGRKANPMVMLFFTMAAIEPFLEATMCTEIKAYGGHAVFDTLIALGVAATAIVESADTDGKRKQS
eukprot:m.349698 g.349698  ORF g.349698 m.349698 type:complete len:254 (+) comp16577_c0_seq5:252-1013(+)